VPGAREGIPVCIERAFVVGGGTALAHPDREGVAVELVDLVEGLAFGEPVIPGLDVRARRLAISPLMTDNFQAFIAA
jgi:hypothetical protein